MLNAIYLPHEGLWAGWELTSDLARSPWVWVRIISPTRNDPRHRHAEACEAVRPLTNSEAAAVTGLQQRGLIVCRVLYVARGNRFARASLE